MRTLREYWDSLSPRWKAPGIIVAVLFGVSGWLLWGLNCQISQSALEESGAFRRGEFKAWVNGVEPRTDAPNFVYYGKSLPESTRTDVFLVVEVKNVGDRSIQNPILTFMFPDSPQVVGDYPSRYGGEIPRDVAPMSYSRAGNHVIVTSSLPELNPGQVVETRLQVRITPRTHFGETENGVSALLAQETWDFSVTTKARDLLPATYGMTVCSFAATDSAQFVRRMNVFAEGISLVYRKLTPFPSYARDCIFQEPLIASAVFPRLEKVDSGPDETYFREVLDEERMQGKLKLKLARARFLFKKSRPGLDVVPYRPLPADAGS